MLGTSHRCRRRLAATCTKPFPGFLYEGSLFGGKVGHALLPPQPLCVADAHPIAPSHFLWTKAKVAQSIVKGPRHALADDELLNVVAGLKRYVLFLRHAARSTFARRGQK